MKDFFNKETLDNIKQFCAENKKYVGVAGVLVGLILILIVLADNTNIALLVVTHRCRKLAKCIKVITHVCLVIISK